MVLEAIKYRRGHLQILDQLRLPHALVYENIQSSQDAWHAIRAMRVRGAPAIAIVAALALAVEIEQLHMAGQLSHEAEDVAVFVQEKLDYLVTSRPTAVNLADAARKLKRVVRTSLHDDERNGDGVRTAYLMAAEKMLVDDVHDNEAIGRHGADWILKNTLAGRRGGTVSVLTHCNTGSLATAGYGTALGVVRSLHTCSALHHAYCTETRPYNQGSRLTAFELVHDQIPSTLITDSMAAALMRQRGREDNLAAVVVGADRVAANGDTANKIGTYALAVLARYHGLKFLIAAPRTTIDLDTACGEAIVIEQRPGHEVTRLTGPKHQTETTAESEFETISIAAPGIDVWNPAFDVTPAELVDGIITERGVIEKGGDGTFSFHHLFGPSGSPGPSQRGQGIP
ncbi:MAG: S-methyl-5-thioribose-1-phosphate isomerase [Thelocarpon superellum]|nr:MAG: S-methyl-5-thioribose-1-phosphate isomerase [Thelocarpon superellum]